MTIQPASKIQQFPVVRTGLFIDKVLGVGGIPKKKIVELVGEPGAGKSTLAMQIVGELQKQGQRCLWADVELSFDPLYAERLGVDNKNLDVLIAQTAEELFDEIEEAVGDGKYDYIFIDSIGALSPRAELEKKSGEVVMAGISRLMGPFLRKVVWKLEHRNVGMIVINHMKVNFATGAIEAAGGEKLNYHKSVSVRLKRKLAIKQGEKIIGYQVVADVWKKNKLFANVGSSVAVDFINFEGFSKSADLLQEAIDRGVITKRGNLYFFVPDLNSDVEEKLGMISKVREMVKQQDFAAKLQDALGLS